MRVFVYCNVNNQGFSIKALDGPHKGLVVARAERLQLKDVEFRPAKEGDIRAVMHCGAIGEITAVWGLEIEPAGDDINNLNETLGVGRRWEKQLGLPVRYFPEEGVYKARQGTEWKTVRYADAVSIANWLHVDTYEHWMMTAQGARE